MLRNFCASLSALIIGAGLADAAELRDGKVIVYEAFQGTVMRFEAESWPKDAMGVVLTVQTPENLSRLEKGEVGFDILVESGGRVPAVDLAKHGKLVEGLYVYEITGSTGEEIAKSEKINNGRGKEADFVLGTFSLGGQFLVEGGKIVVFEQPEEKGSEKPLDGPSGEDADEGNKSEIPAKPGRDGGDEDKF